jgi:hypothetical protein
MHVRGNRIDILPQLIFVALSTLFVAIEVTYCNKMHCCCNIVAILRQLCRVARVSHFVATAHMYCNKINLCGNTRKHIAALLACCISYGHCCKSWLHIATKYVLVVISHFLPQFHCLAIAITYYNKLFIHGNIYNILQQFYTAAKKILQDIATIFSTMLYHS